MFLFSESRRLCYELKQNNTCTDTMQDSYERKLSTNDTYFQVNEVSRPEEKKRKERVPVAGI